MSSARCFSWFCPLYLPAFLFSIVCVFSIMSENLPNQVRKAIRSNRGVSDG